VTPGIRGHRPPINLHPESTQKPYRAGRRHPKLERTPAGNVWGTPPFHTPLKHTTGGGRNGNFDA
jgi:hypothetical protein